MRIFLDFEASSLSDDSYPIEVGWADEDGGCETHLIRPAPDWCEWDPSAEAVHGLSRAQIKAEGEPHERVAHRAVEALQDHEVFVTAPSWDGKWMSVLLRAAGLPRHALRLKESDDAHRAAVQEILGGRVPEPELFELAEAFLQQARGRERGAPQHRALADAQAELEVWREVRRLAEAHLASVVELKS